MNFLWCCGQCGATSKGVPSVLACSVCWTLQCLFSALTQGGWWWTLFWAHLFSRTVGREGHCKQITLVCACSVSAKLGLPLLTAHTAQAQGCSAGNHLRGALGCIHCPPPSPPQSKLLRFRHSGSPQRRRLHRACILCPCQVRAAQVMRCLANAVTATYCLPCPCCSEFWVYNRRTFSGRC